MRTSLVIALLVAISGFLVWSSVTKNGPSEPIACTMEAKICPDGSTVGRTGPNCEFAACPSAEVPSQSACTKELRICPDGSGVGRTGPNCEFAACPQSDDLIIIDSPRPGDTVTSPITVRGRARGNWFFEASFPISVVNWDGLIIGEGIATAEGEWMTTEFVPFTGTISYSIPSTTPYNRGDIIFRKDNPSGLPENDDAREFQIFFSEVRTTQP